MSVPRSFNSVTLFRPWKSWSYSDPLSTLPESISLRISLVDTLHPSSPSTFRTSPQRSRPFTSRTSHTSTCVARMNQLRLIQSLDCSRTPLGCEMFSFFAAAQPRAPFPSTKSPSTSSKFLRCGSTTQSLSSSFYACRALNKSSWSYHSTWRR